MSKEFGDVEANRVFDLYHVGTSRHWRNNDGLSTTFPQINEKGKLCQLKVMAYNPNTGKRMKKQDRAEMWSDKAQKYIPDTRPMDKIWFAQAARTKRPHSPLSYPTISSVSYASNMPTLTEWPQESNIGFTSYSTTS